MQDMQVEISGIETDQSNLEGRVDGIDLSLQTEVAAQDALHSNLQGQLSELATYDYVDTQGFVTQTDMEAEGYVTQADIDASASVLQAQFESSMSGLVTQADMEAEGFVTQTDIDDSIAGLATQVELSVLRGMVGLSRKPYDITLDMTLDDWVQAPYSGAVQEVSDGLHLQGSGYRIGNVIYTKKWFNMIGSTVFMKWKAGDSSYSGFWVGIMTFFSAGTFTTDHPHYSTKIDYDTWIYTTMRCDEDGQCRAKSAKENYADQDGATVIREETHTLTSFEQEQLSATRLYFTFGDNYNSDSTVQSGILGEAKIVDTIEVEKPTTSVSAYDGEAAIPTSFYVDDNGGGGTNCLWEIEEIDEENAIKGSSSSSHSGNCLLALDINNVRGISFSIKTHSPIHNHWVRFGYPHPAIRAPLLLSTTGSSESEWKTYWMPTVMFPTTLHWVVFGSSAVWVKDIKLWYGPSDQERLTELQDQLSLIQTEISDFQERLSELEGTMTSQ